MANISYNFILINYLSLYYVHMKNSDSGIGHRCAQIPNPVDSDFGHMKSAIK